MGETRLSQKSLGETFALGWRGIYLSGKKHIFQDTYFILCSPKGLLLHDIERTYSRNSTLGGTILWDFGEQNTLPGGIFMRFEGGQIFDQGN